MATFWEIADVFFDFELFVTLDISSFGFDGWSWVQIASVSVFATFTLIESKEFCETLNQNIYMT